MNLEVGKYYRIKKNGSMMVGKCLKATPRKCKLEIVFDTGKLEGTQSWFNTWDFDEVVKIEDSHIVLELFK